MEFDYDNYSVYAGRGVSLTSSLKFDNNYRMYISVANFTNNYLYSKENFLKHDSPAAFKITKKVAISDDFLTLAGNDLQSASNKRDFLLILLC